MNHLDVINWIIKL